MQKNKYVRSSCERRKYKDYLKNRTMVFKRPKGNRTSIDIVRLFVSSVS